jgi:hypothetical protein
VVCAYCDSTVMRRGSSLELAGKMAQLAEDASPIQLGTTGTHRGESFEIVGRIQLEYDRGYWNEWYLTYADGRTGWLGQGQGQYVLTQLVPALHAPKRPDTLHTGSTVTLGVEPFRVAEIAKIRCVSGAGELPFKLDVGYDATVVDLSGRGRRFGTLDYSEEPALVFLGERVEYDELKLKNVREFEGW